MEILTFLVLFCFSKGRFFLQHFKSNVVYFPYRIWKATNFNLYNLRFLSCLISKKIYKLLQLFCIYFPSARAQLEAFYHPLSWSTAKSKCGDRGGYLAQLQTSSKVIDLTRLDAVFRPEAIYWVGGHLQDNGWNLYDNRCHNNQSNPGTPGVPSSILWSNASLSSLSTTTLNLFQFIAKSTSILLLLTGFILYR